MGKFQPHLTARTGSRLLLLLWWLLALLGYFGPWSGQRAAALAWNAYDLFDILRVLPQIESGAVQVNLHTLRWPLLGLGVLLPLLLASMRPLLRWSGALLGAALTLLTLPPYPPILTAWRTPGWSAVLWWALAGTAACFLVAGFTSRLGALRRWVSVGVVVGTGIPAGVTFTRLAPALSVLYARPVRAGWGLWLWGAALAVLVATVLAQHEEKPVMNQNTQRLKSIRKVKARYETTLLRKANVVGVGIGQRVVSAEVRETVLVVNVTHKVPAEMLAPEDRIPSEIEGVPVDVLPVGQLQGFQE